MSSPVLKLPSPQDGSSKLTVIDPVVAEMSKLVDEFCVLACDASGVYRSMQAGERKAAAGKLASILKRVQAATGATQVILWEYTKKSPLSHSTAPRLKAAKPLRLVG